MNKQKFIMINIFLFFAVCLLGFIYFLFSPVIYQKEGFTYYVPRGTAKTTFIGDLYRQGIINYPALFYLYIYLHPYQQLKTGEYLFPAGSTPYSIWKQVSDGTGLLYHPFTIIPGWSFNQLRLELMRTDQIRHEISTVPDVKIMKLIGQDGFPEGMFLPDTYNYTRGNSDVLILKKANHLMLQKLSKAWENRDANLPYNTSYEALIAASLVEKEAHFAYELPIIAGVLINRLRNNMLLQFDPTVIYGMGSQYEGKIYKENLSQDTAYNTYIHKGLPPTPIAMPSIAAIEATLHPQQHDYFYFVARGDGSHVFSKTLEEHNAAVIEVGKSKPNQSSPSPLPVIPAKVAP